MSPPDKTPPIINGWIVLAHPVFARRYVALRDDVRRLKGELTADAYKRSPTVKLFAALRRLITEIVPQDPNAPEYMLRGPLARYRRAKGRGLPPRYRLFWIFSTQAKTIIFLYINDEATLRKEGAKSDPYAVFERLVERGDIGADFSENYEAWRKAVEHET